MLNIRYHFVVLGAVTLLAACASGAKHSDSAAVATPPPSDVCSSVPIALL